MVILAELRKQYLVLIFYPIIRETAAPYYTFKDHINQRYTAAVAILNDCYFKRLPNIIIYITIPLVN